MTQKYKSCLAVNSRGFGGCETLVVKFKIV
jgi:hypothetical protein